MTQTEQLAVGNDPCEAVTCRSQPDQKFQIERHGYFVADRVNHKTDKPVSNLAVGFKDS